MSVQTINLDTYSLSLLTAKEDILNPRSSTNWALFAYDGISNKLKLADSGVGGVSELATKFHSSKPQYGLCRIGSSDTGGPRTAMISWMGENVDDFRRTECANHLLDVKNFFKEAHVFLKAEKPEEVTEERIRAELSKAKTNASTQWLRRSSRSLDNEEIVGTNYRKTNAAMEMRRLNRDSFWARAEREEEERKEEERKRAAEERRRLERERALKERKDAEERDRKMNEKLKMIEEQRRKQAEQEEEEHRKEKLKWEQQQREHEEEMRARLKRRESIEKAAEAAALVSQRSMNPREFFRQLSSSSSQSPTSPTRTGKPFRRYQRSLTDTAFIFSKAEESSASSAHTSPLVSPFSRAPFSPFNRATSPPTSPVFHASTSPQRTPQSPPLSPLRPAPPAFALPTVPQVKARAQSPMEPSAPPASPTLLASDLPASVSKGLPASPTNVSHSEEHSTFCFEPSVTPPAPMASPTDKQQPTDLFAELVSDIGYKVQAVLVEEDEDEEEEDAGKNDNEPMTEAQPDSTEAVEWKVVEMDTTQTQPKETVFVQEEVKNIEKEDIEELIEAEETVAEDEQRETEEKLVEVQKENEMLKISVCKEGCDELEITVGEAVEEKDERVEPLEEPVVMLQQEDVTEAEEVPDQSVEDLGHDEHAHILQHEEDLEVTDASFEESQEIKCVTADLPINPIPNGGTPELNGTDHTLSPSDPDLDSPESAVYCDFHETEEDDEEDFTGQHYTKILENGQEVLPDQQIVCVRALYDYQAEDDSELSFEPGDIIKDVEAVDKAWWRGWSKDGRQGLFPANYVETISPQ